MAADVRVRAFGRNGSGGDTVVALNGTPVNGSGWEPPPVPLIRLEDAVPVWPPASNSWPGDAPDEVELERARLEAEIAATKAQAAAARRRDTEIRAALHAEVVALQQRVAEMEQQHDMDLVQIREDAQAEVARILSDARRRWRALGRASRWQTARVNSAERRLCHTGLGATSPGGDRTADVAVACGAPRGCRRGGG